MAGDLNLTGPPTKFPGNMAPWAQIHQWAGQLAGLSAQVIFVAGCRRAMQLSRCSGLDSWSGETR